MKVFIHKKSGVKWYALELYVREGDDAWFIKGANISLPKSEWEAKEDKDITL